MNAGRRVERIGEILVQLDRNGQFAGLFNCHGCRIYYESCPHRQCGRAQRTVTRITIGERCGPPDTDEVLRDKGIGKLCKEHDLDLINFEEDLSVAESALANSRVDLVSSQNELARLRGTIWQELERK